MYPMRLLRVPCLINEFWLFSLDFRRSRYPTYSEILHQSQHRGAHDYSPNFTNTSSSATLSDLFTTLNNSRQLTSTLPYNSTSKLFLSTIMTAISFVQVISIPTPTNAGELHAIFDAQHAPSWSVLILVFFLAVKFFRACNEKCKTNHISPTEYSLPTKLSIDGSHRQITIDEGYRLNSNLDSVRSSQALVQWLYGPAGAGKSAIVGASIESQFLEVVVKPLESLPRERWGNLPKVVIIDGLDECQGRPRYRIPLRFLIASRPEPQIRDIFNKPEYLDITTRTEIGDNYSTSRDIERYLRDSFHKIALTSDVIRSVPLPWPSQGVIDNLVQRASGQFIYASTLIKYVSDEHSHPMERLELALGLPIGDPDAFSDLDLLYRQIMSSSRNRPRLLQILGAFYCLQEMSETPGLTYPRSHPRESTGLMENILLLSPGAISLALRSLHSVLEINQYSFRFRHKSFADFLFDERRSGEFFLDLPLYYAWITECCIKL
ncbi:hypothetical protein K435DRAFT_971701 [Dendrothele bispora CBS 962.96]|uniref:NACHT domain-containing protein n=1 Tax=Dendrothele bispora (strain CBS 962.96) TaxID=1314807 RepID=A0A4S8L3M4_DENBC|nr:hypothetical protein K435DRAFT_971701 [Dendrothele bispora CBS 962.96]